MSNIIVIGAGMVGSAMAIDLTSKHKVTCTDVSQKALIKLTARHPDIATKLLDVTDFKALHDTISTFDLVLCAVPGFLGYQTLEQIILAGKNVVDISFFPENCLELDQLAKDKGVTAIVDCGVAPGMDNIILGYYNEKMTVTDFECLVGGLPKIKKWPYNYKAPFSPIDVIEEYTRPARYVENGHEVIKPAMSDIDHVEFDNVGTLESFNSDGLRSIIHTMPHIPNMKEKTLRYPGHIDKIIALRDGGFLDTEAIEMNGQSIRPIDFTSKILFDEWKLGDTEPEITVMSVTVAGTDVEGRQKKVVYYLHDEYNAETQTSSMARTTGYTATAAVNLFLDGVFNEKGVFPPELVGKHEACFQYFLQYLEARGVIYKEEIRRID
ncbi:MAG: saccharopine dehydrogenase NADP-binding domain-containing protein [Cyclobacteriaceae bacterium]